MHDSQARQPRRPPKWWVAMVVVGALLLAVVVTMTVLALGDEAPDPADIPVNGGP